MGSPAGLVPGDHVCWAYQSDAEFRTHSAAYVGEGVAQGQRVVWYTSGDPAAVRQTLASAGVPVTDLERAGQLVVGDARTARAPDGRIDPARMAATHHEAVAQARAEGYATLRALGDPWWAGADADWRASLLASEYRAGGVAAETGMISLCAYDRRRCDAESLQALAALHAARVGEPRLVGTAFSVLPTADGAVAVRGEVDVSGSPVFETVMRAVMGWAGERPRVNLGDLTFIDVAGLRALARVVEETSAAPRLVMARPIVRQCWTLLDFDDLAPVAWD